MKPSQLINLFKIGVDKASPAAYTGVAMFTTEEEIAIINQAYYEVVNGKFGGKNQYSKEFNESPVIIDELSGLITETTITAATSDGYNGYSVTIANTVLHIISVVYQNATQRYAAVEVPPNTIHKFLATADNKPIIPNPVYTRGSGIIKIYVDSLDTLAPTSIIVKHIKKPTQLTTALVTTDADITEVGDSVFQEVINRAVVIALYNIESPRAQIQAQLEMSKDYAAAVAKGRQTA
jgi:hypothetical protein